jgi:hypothetical protein
MHAAYFTLANRGAASPRQGFVVRSAEISDSTWRCLLTFSESLADPLGVKRWLSKITASVTLASLMPTAKVSHRFRISPLM